MEICVKILLFHIFSFFLALKHDFIRRVDFSRTAASNTAMMTSLIRSHIEYLIQTYRILVLILESKLMKNLA